MWNFEGEINKEKNLLNCFGQLQSAWGNPSFDSFALVLQEVEQVGIMNRFCVRQTIFQGGLVCPSGPLFCSAKAEHSEAFEFWERQYRMPFLSRLPFPEGPYGADLKSMMPWEKRVWVWDSSSSWCCPTFSLLWKLIQCQVIPDLEETQKPAEESFWSTSWVYITYIYIYIL